MIDEDRTFQCFEYRSTDLTTGSHKPIIVMCEGCGGHRVTQRRRSKEGDLCISCTLKKRWDDPEARDRQRDIQKTRYKDPVEREKTSASIKKHYEDNPATRKRLSTLQKIAWADPEVRKKASETHKKMWDDPELRNQRSEMSKKMWTDPVYKEKMSNMQKKRYEDPKERERTSMSSKRGWADIDVRSSASATHKKLWQDPEHREKMLVANKKNREDPEYHKKLSAGLQGIPYEEWQGFAKDQPYCPKFNEACRESNREKYDRRCFLTGLPEAENITATGKQQKLSVHHVDMNKQQGCDGYRWRLVPIALGLHGKTHNPTWISRIQYLLENVWC